MHDLSTSQPRPFVSVVVALLAAACALMFVPFAAHAEDFDGDDGTNHM